MIRGVERSNKIVNKTKGFTLVELIVVLVILAILAAVVIPLMLGFTDDARKKRYIADANAALKASQTVITEVYNEGGNLLDGTKRYKAWSMSGVDEVDTFDSSCTSFTVWTGKQLETNKTVATSDNISSYTIVCAKFVTSKKDGKKVLFYDGKEWNVFDNETELEKNNKYKELISSSQYGNNEIKMWPNSSGCDTAYGTIDPGVKPWYDHDNPPIVVQKVMLHGYKQNGGGVYFLSDEFADDDTPAKRNYGELEVTYKFNGANQEFDWEGGRDIKTGYKIKVDGESEGYYKFVGWAVNDPNSETVIKESDLNSSEFIAMVRDGQISHLYARAYQVYDTVKVNFKAFNGNTLGFGEDEENTTTVNSVIFRKYRNTDADYSKNTGMVDSSGNDVPACSIGQMDDNVILFDRDNNAFGGWAFYASGYNGSNGSAYERETGTKPKQYTSVGELWEKVFKSNPSVSGGTDQSPAVQSFEFVGIVEKTQTIRLYADVNSRFKNSGNMATYFLYRFAEMSPDDYVDTLDEYEEDPLIVDPNYRHKGWSYQIGGSSLSTPDNGIDGIRSVVTANRDINEFSFTAITDPGSRTKFVGRSDSGSSASGSSFVGQILSLAGGRNANVKKFSKLDYDTAISKLDACSGIGDILEGTNTTERDDDKVIASTGTVLTISDSVVINDGYAKQLVVLWDGNDETYDIPSFACSVEKTDGTIDIYWFSQSDSPLLDGDFSYAFEGYSAMSFAGCGADAWNTSGCESMAHMFEGCGIGDTQITFGAWDYSSVESMQGMFKSATNLTNVYLPSENMDSVESMEEMFMNSTKLKTVTLNGVSAKSLETTKNMFAGCSSINNLNLTGVNTTKVMAGETTSGSITNTSNMFKDCAKLLTIDVSGLNTSNVEDASHMFDGCVLLNTITVKKSDGGSDFIFADKIKNVEYMFSKCHVLTTLDLRGFTDCTILTNVQYWFDECYKMQYIDLSNFRPTNLNKIIFIFNRVGYDKSAGDKNRCGIFACAKWGCAENVETRKVPNTNNANDDNAYAWMRIRQYDHNAYKSANDYNSDVLVYNPESHLKPEEEGAAAVIVTKPKTDATRFAGGYFMSSESRYYKDWRVDAYPNETFSD